MKSCSSAPQAGLVRPYSRVCTKSWILEKVWKFVSYFSRPGKSMVIKAKSWKMGWSLEFFSRSSRCLKASWNLCNVADFTLINLAKRANHFIISGGTSEIVQVRELLRQSPTSNALHCIMVHCVSNASWFIFSRFSWAMKNLTITLSVENKKSGLEKVWKKSSILPTKKCTNPVTLSNTILDHS